MVIIFVYILELNYVTVYLMLCFISPRIYSVDNTIRHQEADEFPTLQDSDHHQFVFDSNIEITKKPDCNFWVSAGGEGVAGVQLIIDPDIVSKLDTKMLLPTKFGAHHNEYWGELLGDTIFYGEEIHPKDAK